MTQFKRVLSILKTFFFDSYTGWKKKRIALSLSSGALVVLLTITILVEGEAPKTIHDVLSDASIFEGKEGGSGNSSFSSPSEGNNEPIAAFPYLPDVVNTIITSVEQGEEKNETDETVYKGYEPPAIGDIIAFGGIPEEVEAEENVEQYSGKYEAWENKSELYASVRLATEKIQYNYLQYMDTVIEKGNWSGFAADISLYLLDAPAIGDQVRSNFTEDTVAIWDKLELVYRQLYLELYACENATDFQKVANGETRVQATELTGSFIDAINSEALSIRE